VVGCSGGGGATNRPTVTAAASLAIPSGAASQAAGSAANTAAQQLCGLLTANDWATVNLSQATNQPTINSDGPNDAYCVYNGKSGATGGLEFDAFVDQSASDATDTFTTMSGELPGAQSVDLPGVDAALINPDVDGTYGVIIVRDGRFSYSISLPTSSGAQTQLETLASLVLTRAQQYK